MEDVSDTVAASSKEFHGMLRDGDAPSFHVIPSSIRNDQNSKESSLAVLLGRSKLISGELLKNGRAALKVLLNFVLSVNAQWDCQEIKHGETPPVSRPNVESRHPDIARVMDVRTSPLSAPTNLGGASCGSFLDRPGSGIFHAALAKAVQTAPGCILAFLFSGTSRQWSWIHEVGKKRGL